MGRTSLQTIPAIEMWEQPCRGADSFVHIAKTTQGDATFSLAKVAVASPSLVSIVSGIGSAGAAHRE